MAALSVCVQWVDTPVVLAVLHLFAHLGVVSAAEMATASPVQCLMYAAVQMAIPNLPALTHLFAHLGVVSAAQMATASPVQCLMYAAVKMAIPNLPALTLHAHQPVMSVALSALVTPAALLIDVPVNAATLGLSVPQRRNRQQPFPCL